MEAQGGYRISPSYERVLAELGQIYEAKNHDYGDSFAKIYAKYGLQSTVIRLWDKLLRLETLSERTAKVEDETIEDTLMDIANYAVMTVMEMRENRASDFEQRARAGEGFNVRVRGN